FDPAKTLIMIAFPALAASDKNMSSPSKNGLRRSSSLISHREFCDTWRVMPMSNAGPAHNSSRFWHPMLHPNEMNHRAPIRIIRGDGCYIYDDAGKKLVQGNPELAKALHVLDFSSCRLMLRPG